MIVVLSKIIMIICVFALVCCLFMLVRCEIIYRNRLKIINAIEKYNIDRINRDDYENLISYDCLEDFEKTTRRLWDFGYKRIVSEDVFRKICGYLK